MAPRPRPGFVSPRGNKTRDTTDQNCSNTRIHFQSEWQWEPVKAGVSLPARSISSQTKAKWSPLMNDREIGGGCGETPDVTTERSHRKQAFGSSIFKSNKDITFQPMIKGWFSAGTVQNHLWMQFSAQTCRQQKSHGTWMLSSLKMGSVVSVATSTRTYMIWAHRANSYLFCPSLKEKGYLWHPGWTDELSVVLKQLLYFSKVLNPAESRLKLN